MTVRETGLVKANEEFAAWLMGERSMPFGEHGEHATIRLIDFDDPKQNRFVVSQQFTFRAGKAEKRADLVLLVNGMPLVVIEAKTPVRTRRTSPSCSSRTRSPSPRRGRSTATARSACPWISG